MKKLLFLAAVLGAAAAPLAAAESGNAVGTNAAPVTARSTPGIEAARAISTITGVAISPLLGVSTVGAWKYFKTPGAQRSKLPWFAQPWFWIPALVLVGLVCLKDIAGTGMPTALKKPLDVAEAFENKVSALVAAGLFVPLIASIFGASVTGDGSFYQAAGMAAFDPASLLNVLTVPVAIVAFLVVWLVANVINVLILISPFGVVDAALKTARLLLLSAVAGISYTDPYVGAGFSLVIIVICYFLSGWAFRMTVFGTVFGWDFVTLRHKRFKPEERANRAFLARAIDKVPLRTLGKLVRDDQGQLALEYRPWLVLSRRTVRLPAGRYAVGRGLLFPELLLLGGAWERAVVTLPPRCLGHEQELTQIYRLEPARDIGLVKGFKAVWIWLKDLFGVRRKTEAAAPA
jgi:hypothetical protein